MTVLVGRARLADAPAIATIYNQGIADRIATFETEPRTALDVERQFDERGELNLCGRLGFREVGTYRHHAQLDGVWRDVVIVELLLDGARAAGG